MSQTEVDTEPRLALRSVDTVPEGARVRHFDQLDERTQERVLALVDGADFSYATGTDLRHNDVVVFTDYFLAVAE